MGYLVYFVIASAAIVVALSVLLIRQRMRNRKLERLLDHTNSRLEQLQLHFGRFTPQEVIEHLTEPDGSYAARMRSVTVLFADLKGFTKMCDNRDPAEVVSILNGYFQCMSEALANHHGQVTELMGDGMLTLFGALRSNPWQVQDAVMGALAMRKALVEYNEELRSNSKSRDGVCHRELRRNHSPSKIFYGIRPSGFDKRSRTHSGPTFSDTT